jgi:1-acyl-sn-glycerol-3-phosphate acyltransferase
MQKNALPSMTASTGAPAQREGSWKQRVSRGWRIVRTAFGFAALGMASLLLSLVVLPLLRVFPGSQERKELRAQQAIHWFVRAYLRGLRILRILRIRCTGAARLREPGTLVVANHPTLIDALVLMSLMPQADCVVKQRYYEDPFVGGTARGAGYIPSRGGPELVADCVERLVQGRSLIIFPEGTRSPVNGLAPFARGAAHIALRAGRDPLPVTIRCEPSTLYHGQAWWDVPERRFTLTLRVGEPLRVKEAVGEQTCRGQAARALTASLREYFERRVDVVEA